MAKDVDQETHFYRATRNFGAGLAAVGGLMCAACIGAIAASDCRAMALVMEYEIQLFGGAAVSGIGILGGLTLKDLLRGRRSRIDTVMIVAMLVIGHLAIAGGIFESLHLPAAVDECWPAAQTGGQRRI